MLDRYSLRDCCDNIDIVYHLAAKTDINGKSLGDYKVNYVGTKNIIAEAVVAKSVDRFVFYSTQLVVGLFNETRFIDETEPYRTNTIYGKSKIEGEKIVQKYCQQASLSYTIIRPTSVYGPWGKEPYEEFFKTIKNGRYYHVGKANNLVSLVYVENLINLTILASLSNDAKNEIFFGNDFHPYTMRQIVKEVSDHYKIKVKSIPVVIITPIAYAMGILKLMGLNVPLYPFRLKNIKTNYCYNIQKSIGIGYNPQYNLKSGIKKTLNWYEDNIK